MLISRIPAMHIYIVRGIGVAERARTSTCTHARTHARVHASEGGRHTWPMRTDVNMSMGMEHEHEHEREREREHMSKNTETI